MAETLDAHLLLSSCETCEILKAPDNVLLETEYWLLILAQDQAYLGRSYVTLRSHKQSLSELSSEEWLDFAALAKRLEQGYEKVFGSGRPFNWACMMNNAFKEPQPVPHVHWHVRPRHKHPITINGITFEDPEYGHHYDRNRRVPADTKTLDAIKAVLQKHL
jgi:diadenosine tetraphosphate (Ap4A) HIT family hydrolase